MSALDDWNRLPLDKLWVRLVSDRAINALIEAAASEDMGRRGDITSDLTIDPHTTATAKMIARKPGRLCGMHIVARVAKRYDPDLAVKLNAADGDAIGPGQAAATITGPMRSILAAERVMLNFACHLSGIATLTDRYVQAVARTGAKIYDTRKTIPAYRTLAKYAVRCGGGMCHRIGLHDAVLIKDNHLAFVNAASLGEKLATVLAQAKALAWQPVFIEVEVDTLEQFEAAIEAGVDVILLDNMSPELMTNAVAMRDQKAVATQLEASGGIDLDTVGASAESGVDRIAIGALTHSAPSLDLGLDIQA